MTVYVRPVMECAICGGDLWDEDEAKLYWARSEDGLRMEAVFVHPSCDSD